MPNVNCLAGIKCPQCGQQDRFLIAAQVMAEVTDDGADIASPEDGGSLDWDENSLTSCPDCDRAGTLSEFQVLGEESA